MGCFPAHRSVRRRKKCYERLRGNIGIVMAAVKSREQIFSVEELRPSVGAICGGAYASAKRHTGSSGAFAKNLLPI